MLPVLQAVLKGWRIHWGSQFSIALRNPAIRCNGLFAGKFSMRRACIRFREADTLWMQSKWNRRATELKE
jgi:hypothetical protein